MIFGPPTVLPKFVPPCHMYQLWWVPPPVDQKNKGSECKQNVENRKRGHTSNPTQHGISTVLYRSSWHWLTPNHHSNYDHNDQREAKWGFWITSVGTNQAWHPMQHRRTNIRHEESRSLVSPVFCPHCRLIRISSKREKMLESIANLPLQGLLEVSVQPIVTIKAIASVDHNIRGIILRTHYPRNVSAKSKEEPTQDWPLQC